MLRDVLNDFSEFVGGKFDKLNKDVEALKKAATKGKAVDLHDKKSLRLANTDSYRFGSNLNESEADVPTNDEFERAKDKVVTWNGKRLLPSPYINTAFAKYQESRVNGLYRPLSVFPEALGQTPPLGPDVINLVPLEKLDGQKFSIPDASSVAVVACNRVGPGVHIYDYIIRAKTISDTEDLKEKQVSVWHIAGNGLTHWKTHPSLAAFSDGILTLGTNIGGAIVAVVFNDGSRACYKIAARVAGFSTLPRFRTNILHTGTEAVSGGTSKEELDQATRYEWGEDVVYPPVPSIEQFYTPQQVQVRLNDLEFDEEVDSQGDYRIANVSVLIPENLTEKEVLETIRSLRSEKTNYRIKRPVISLAKGKEYKFKIKLNNPPMLAGNVSIDSDGIVTVSANATEKDSVFGDAFQIVIG